MELRGLADFVLFQMDDQGKLITSNGIGKNGLFVVNLASSKGATQANITGVEKNTTVVYGSDSSAETEEGAPAPQVALAANDIPHAVLDFFEGGDNITDGATGTAFFANTAAVKGGVIIHSHGANGTDYFQVFPYGTFAAGNLNLGTNQANATVVHDALTFKALSRPKDLLMYSKHYSDDKGYDLEKVLAYAIDGYVPGTVVSNGKTLALAGDSAQQSSTASTSSQQSAEAASKQ